jgi:o-succinylbenzoate---CoA ligase
MLIRVLEDPLFQVHSGFKAILLGGGPISLDLINKSVTRGIPVVSSYGMTESCAQIAANAMLNPSGTYPPKASAGTVFPPNQIQIRDENGKIQPPLEQGQIWLKGPQIFDGYLVNELNKDVFDEEGWFNTGDFGHLNRNNQLFIENRRSDLIITGGENVNPLKVETALNELPHVVESAVIGIPDPKWGQRIVAFIIPGDHSFKEDQIRNDLQKKLQGFQIPKEFIEVSELPKSSIGKIKKVDLIRLYEQKLP